MDILGRFASIRTALAVYLYTPKTMDILGRFASIRTALAVYLFLFLSSVIID